MGNKKESAADDVAGAENETAPESTDESVEPKVGTSFVASDSGMDFHELINILVPPDEISVTDIFGKTHHLPSSCSARAQIKIIREFEAIKDLPVAENAMSSVSANSGMAGVVSALVSVATDPQVLGTIASSFGLAFPATVAEVKKTAADAGLEFEDAADLFAIEELVSAIIPLCFRPMQRGVQAMSALNRVVETKGSM